MQENIRKIVAGARKAGCSILAVPLPVFRACQARVGDHKGRTALAKTSQKVSQKRAKDTR